jgi:hypothetical protein
MASFVLWNIDSVDVLFLGGALVIAAVLTLLANPLTSWVSRLVDPGKQRSSPDKK